jgi:hypothetical protein
MEKDFDLRHINLMKTEELNYLAYIKFKFHVSFK